MKNKKSFSDGISLILIVIGIVLSLVGVIWHIVVYFDNWKYELTYLGHVAVYWKCNLTLFIGLVLFLIGFKKLYSHS